MIDELDLAFDEHAERGKPRHRRGVRGAGGGKGRGGRNAIAFLLAFVLLATLGGGVYLGYNKVRDFFTAADYDGAGTDQTDVRIEEDSSLTDMGNTLVAADVVKSTKAFTNAAEKHPQGRNIQPGTYRMRKQMSAEAAVALMLDPAGRIVNGVTIPEGRTAKEVYELLAKATGLPVEEYEAAAKDPEKLGVPAFWFKRGDKQRAAKTIEGFLFPDTYEFDPKATAAQNLEVMVEHFKAVTAEIGFVDRVQKNLSVSPFEALTVASLAQAEAGIPADLPKVARVAYNRAYKAKIPLQFDVTANYWLALNGKKPKHSGQLTAAELDDPKNPYNTKSRAGLPVGPINNPGKAALQGAQNPPAANWLFFVAIDKTGRSAFADTNEEHDRNREKACRNGIPLC